MSTKRKINDYFTKRSKTIDEPQLIPNKVQITSEILSRYFGNTLLVIIMLLLLLNQINFLTFLQKNNHQLSKQSV